MWNAFEIQRVLNVDMPQGWSASGVSIDTRTLKKGELFVALKGKNFDGHDYCVQADKAGASAVLVEKTIDGLNCAQIVVPDALEALEKLARAARERFKGRIVAITGSVGKTSTKEALGLVLSEQGQTYVTPRSFNNHWGVPLTMANLPEHAKYAVIEMGMNHAGEISGHTKNVRPHIAYITNIEAIHIGNFDSIDGIAYAKSEIFEGLVPDGIAIVNGATNCSEILRAQAERAGFEPWVVGYDQDCHVQPVEITPNNGHQDICLQVFGEQVDFTLDVPGRHWADVGVGVITVVKALDANIEQAAKRLRDFRPLAGRGQVHSVALNSKSRIRIIDESYNAGPVSMRAALKVLGGLKPEGQGRRIAVLGDMLELGDREETEHKNLKDVICENHVDHVFTSGKSMRYLSDELPADKKGAHEDDPSSLGDQVVKYVQPGDVIMVKGSRGGYHANGRMYAVVESLLNLDQKLGAKKAQ